MGTARKRRCRAVEAKVVHVRFGVRFGETQYGVYVRLVEKMVVII